MDLWEEKLWLMWNFHGPPDGRKLICLVFVHFTKMAALKKKKKVVYLLLWCQCPCFKWKKKKKWPLCFVLCTQDCWKSKGIPFLWLTQLKSSCHSNMRSQLSWFCFILNKLFLLRKMVFLPGSELTTNVWPLCWQRRGSCCCCPIELIVVGLEQEAGRAPTLSRWPTCGTNQKDSSWLPCCGPRVCSEKGVTCCVSPQRDGAAVLLLARKKQGSTALRLGTVAKSGASLVGRAGVPEF